MHFNTTHTTTFSGTYSYLSRNKTGLHRLISKKLEEVPPYKDSRSGKTRTITVPERFDSTIEFFLNIRGISWKRT